ncbi:hypothetical protein L2E82_39591 [Cichorium intybus]|uniref:Uncharacterized protein n=1 Tax=Cichorium intybus TaxID=13427 RepID=A0ACB9AJM5_CICIN|nr:hypothetical protein L2E82_39591 [Cichorium intybus]
MEKGEGRDTPEWLNAERVGQQLLKGYHNDGAVVVLFCIGGAMVKTSTVARESSNEVFIKGSGPMRYSYPGKLHSPISSSVLHFYCYVFFFLSSFRLQVPGSDIGRLLCKSWCYIGNKVLFTYKAYLCICSNGQWRCGNPVGDYFGIRGDAPQVYSRYLNLTFENLKDFGEGFLEEKLKAFYKSDPIPENNDDDVKIVVGNNFEDIVLDESRNVLLEIYAPWCGHCHALEPTYNKLAKHLRYIDSLVIAKMDGTTNEHPRAKADGYPTILFYPAGNKSVDHITVDVDRTVNKA